MLMNICLLDQTMDTFVAGRQRCSDTVNLRCLQPCVQVEGEVAASELL